MVDADSAKKVVCYCLKPLLHLVLQQVDQRYYLFETCHLVCNDLTCIEEFFKDCGEVVDVPFSVDDTGRFKRFRHVEFAIPEAAQSALELNEHELLNHPVRLDLARERGSYILGGREISRVSVLKDFESGGPKCFAYINFKDFSSMKKALELNETELAGGYYLSVEDRVMVVDAEAYTYDNEVINKAEAMGKPKNPEEEATVETTRAIKHHQES
ncbi:hypothetical protein HN51_037438 [Arachis hypogaea]